MTSQNTLNVVRTYQRSVADTLSTGHATEHSLPVPWNVLFATLLKRIVRNGLLET